MDGQGKEQSRDTKNQNEDDKKQDKKQSRTSVLGQPMGDINASSSTQSYNSNEQGKGQSDEIKKQNEDDKKQDKKQPQTTVPAQPMGDINTSSSIHSYNGNKQGSPVGDISSSTSVGVFEGHAQGSGQQVGNCADAFTDNDEYSHGPSVERLPLAPGRPLHEFHLGKVSAKATKKLNNDLMDALEITSDSERQRIKNIKDRKESCCEILRIWRSRGNSTVEDLKLLLEHAGGEEQIYADTINDIVNSPP